jgi:hypothetical protein
MAPSLKKGSAVSKKTQATRPPTVLSPKTKKACRLKLKTPSSHSTTALGEADNMAIDPVDNGSCGIEIHSNDGEGTDDDDDKTQLGALPLLTHDNELSEQ